MPTFVRMRKGGIKFIYDALGNKWYKFSKDGAMDEAKGTAYIFGMQYEFKENNHIQYDWKLMFIGTDEGYVSAVYPDGIDNKFKFQYVYNHTDHLGNIRQNITKENGRLTVLREHNYYPFGLLHRGYNEEKEDLKYDKEQDFIFTVQAQAGRYKYKFQGQERQEDLDLGWDSFKYRNYDYAIGRFFNVDPLAEKFPYMTVYQFAGNKPVWSPEIEGLESGVDVWMHVRDMEILNGENDSNSDTNEQDSNSSNQNANDDSNNQNDNSTDNQNNDSTESTDNKSKEDWWDNIKTGTQVEGSLIITRSKIKLEDDVQVEKFFNKLSDLYSDASTGVNVYGIIASSIPDNFWKSVAVGSMSALMSERNSSISHDLMKVLANYLNSKNRNDLRIVTTNTTIVNSSGLVSNSTSITIYTPNGDIVKEFNY